jgi:hypothetical protein
VQGFSFGVSGEAFAEKTPVFVLNGEAIVL